MIVFLTSSPSGPLNVPNDYHLLDEQNGFLDNLKKYWKKEMKGLIIAAFPESYSQNNEMTSFFTDAFKNANLMINFDILDNRFEVDCLSKYDFIMLAGGHVPTQNAYFHKIGLKKLLQDYHGIVMGVSAGSMNAAHIVYAQPELEGESSPNFKRYLDGLGLTTFNILPHYQMVKDYYLDGKRLFEQITYPDSYHTNLYCLLDGSYILIENENTYLYGEAYIIKDGSIRIITTKNNVVLLDTLHY